MTAARDLGGRGGAAGRAGGVAGGGGGRDVLAVRDLRVRFRAEGQTIAAVDGASFEVRAGEVHGLVGESGSGKSVTGLTLLGLTRGEGAEVSGSAVLNPRRNGAGGDGNSGRGGRGRDGDIGGGSGEPVDLIASEEATLRRLRGSRISIVFQDPLSSLNPYMRVADQVAEAIASHRGLSGAQARERAVELLAEVGIPDAARRASDYPHRFSGGMRQRVMIAIAIANEPDLLIADEPTTALDVTTQATILDLLDRLRRDHGISILLITHDLGIVAERADRISVMRDGQIVEAGPAAEVLGAPRSAYTREMIDSIPHIDAPRTERETPHRPQDAAATAGGGGTGKAGATPGAVLEVRALRKDFHGSGRIWRARREGTLRAVDSVDFSLEPGQTLGVVGESGSGKSTLCRLIARLTDPSGGSIFFRGRDIASLDRRRMRPIRAEIQMIFQDPFASLNPRRRVGDIIAAPIAVHERLSRRELTARVDALLERVGLSAGDRRRYPHQFSGGQRQRIAIARAIGPRPRLLLADEPVSSLDVTVQARILALLRELREEMGLAQVFVSHDIGVVHEVADRIAVMREGRIVEIGTAEQVCRRPRHPYTQVLLAAVPEPVVTGRSIPG